MEKNTEQSSVTVQEDDDKSGTEPSAEPKSPKKIVNRKYILVFLVVFAVLVALVWFNFGLYNPGHQPLPDQSILIPLREDAESEINTLYLGIEKGSLFTIYPDEGVHAGCVHGLPDFGGPSPISNKCIIRITKLYAFSADSRAALSSFDQVLRGLGAIQKSRYSYYLGDPRSGTEFRIQIDFAEEETPNNPDAYFFPFQEFYAGGFVPSGNPGLDVKDLIDLERAYSDLFLNDTYVLVVSIEKKFFENYNSKNPRSAQ